MNDEARQPGPGLAATLVWTLAIAGLAAYVAYNQAIRQLQGEFATRPPVAVLDVAAIASRWKEGDTPAERATNGLRAAGVKARELSARGYLVLDRQYVLAMPEPAKTPEGTPEGRP